MAEDIVRSLFGPAPWEIQQQRNQALQQQAAQYAQQTPLQRAAAGMYQAGGMLGGVAANALGMEDPAVAEASKRNAAMAGIDLSSPESIMQRAAQTQDPRLKMQLTLMAQKLAAERQKAALEGRKVEVQEKRQASMEEFQKSQLAAQTEMKQQQLAQAYEIAKMRSEDTRLGIQQRTEAAREANQIKLMLGQMMQDARMAGIEQRREAVAAKNKPADEKTAIAKQNLSSSLDDLQAAYDFLNEKKAIPSEKRGAASNISSWTANTGVGQLAGKMFGTEEQTQRNVIGSARMLLLNDIKNATGMTAQQMNSNVELQNWLNALGDPSLGYESASKIINNIRKKYVDGGAAVTQKSQDGWSIRPKGQ